LNHRIWLTNIGNSLEGNSKPIFLLHKFLLTRVFLCVNLTTSARTLCTLNLSDITSNLRLFITFTVTTTIYTCIMCRHVSISIYLHTKCHVPASNVHELLPSNWKAASVAPRPCCNFIFTKYYLSNSFIFLQGILPYII
jgi:hypothetical protein